jgi:hypothetical protein
MINTLNAEYELFLEQGLPDGLVFSFIIACECCGGEL